MLDLRRPQFWITQALVLVAVASIYLMEAGVPGPDPAPGGRLTGALLIGVVTLPAVPVIYAAITFGLDAAILTALWLAALAGPMLLLNGPGPLDRIVGPAVLIAILAIGTVLALRVDAERGARERAEALSARLTLLHEVMQVLAERERVPVVLDHLAGTVRRGMNADYATIHYAPPDTPIDAPIEAVSGDPAVRADTADACTVPLTGEAGPFGAITVVRPGRPYSTEECRVLAIAGLEVSSALELRLLEEHRRRALEMYARQMTTAQEAERTRIARDLHDGPVQLLAGLVRAADLIEKERDSSGAAFGAAVERVRDMAESALTELRSVTRDLRPMTLHRLGLHAALRSLASDVSGRSGVQVDLHFDEGPPLPEEVDLCIFRITQEALTNVTKHANATRVLAEIRRTPNEIRVEVRDNGRGVQLSADPSDFAEGGRFGLLGMRERAALFGGTLEITSPVPGTTGGTSVALRIPLAG